MIKEFFKMAGVKNEKEFLNKYPTEESFFRQHPQALRLLEQSSPFMPSYADAVMPQAMYGMGMTYGGSYLPKAQGGYQVPPRQEDYPDYESFSAAMDQYIMSLQQQADNPTPAAVQAQSQSMAGIPTAPPTGMSPATKLNPYKGLSIVDFLVAQGKPSDFASRKQLASSLGIANYRGTASQNTQLLQMLQGAPDALAQYQGLAQPTANVTKRAAAGKNAGAAPTTEELAAAKYEATGGVDENQPLRTRRGDTPRRNMPPDYSRALPFNNDMSNLKVKRNVRTQLFEPVPPAEGMMSVEYGNRKKLADQLNSQEALRNYSNATGQPTIGRAPGYKDGGAYTGTWNANQGFDMGGSYVPDYTSNLYSIPKFGLGSNMYQDGGMTQQQPQFDQQELIQTIFQMIQQGLPAEQILQQLVQNGVPQEMAQQLIMMVMQQVQGGGMQGGQEGMGGGQPNGVNPSAQAAMPQEQGMEGMPGMAYGGSSYGPGWEGEVDQNSLDELRRNGINFEIID